MSSVRRRSTLVTAVLLVVLAGCATDGSSSDGSDGSDASEASDASAAGQATSDAPVREVVDADTALDLLDARDDLTVIDVRTPEEFDQGHLTDARLMDLSGGQFEAEVGDLDPERAYVLYCRTGARSADAAAIMADLGFVEVYDAGGFDDLAAVGADTTTG